jgi:Ca2+-binding RTX toxin-like protein
LDIKVFKSIAKGTQFTIINNDGDDAVVGTFFGIPEGAIIDNGYDKYLITYVGGDGNDVVLTALTDVRAVTNTLDADPGSLRFELNAANAIADPVAVIFRIEGAGPFTISPESQLPAVTGLTYIDATTQDNFTGTPAVQVDGSAAGAADGFRFEAGSDGSLLRGLSITGFQQNGVQIIGANRIWIAGNYIGVNLTGDLTGEVDNGNLGDGIDIYDSRNSIVGGPNPQDRNVISGNDGAGVRVRFRSSGVMIEGNYIGLNAAGTGDLGNSGPGVLIEASGSPADAARNNQVGVIGGAQNVISGNDQEGVVIRDAGVTGNSVQNNYIGLNAAGSALVPNAREGVLITGGAAGNAVGAAGAGNVIAGTVNSYAAISIATSGNKVQGNRIGTDATGAITLGGYQGVQLLAAGNTVGGKSFGDGNTIRGMTTEGIVAVAGNVYLGNSIFDSGALGIDNGQDGVTAALLPIIDLAVVGVALTRIGGVVNAAANTTYRIELFSSSAANGSGFGEGETYLGFTTVTTDAAGLGRFKFATPTQISLGYFISATATLEGVSTSEFAQSVALRSALVVTSTNDAGAGSLREAIDNANLASGGDVIEFDIAGPGPHTITLATELPDVIGLTVIDGRSEPDFAGAPVVELDGSAVPGVGIDLQLGADGSEIYGMVIGGFVQHGINIEAADVTIAGNYIGLDATGAVANANGEGIVVFNAARATIGGSAAGDRNVISGNISNGILIFGAGSLRTRVQGNIIGLSADETFAIGNTDGVRIAGPASGLLVGTDGDGVADATEGNVIAGNANAGVIINDSHNAVVAGNIIGAASDGVTIFGNSLGVAIGLGSVGARVGTDGDGVSDNLERNIVTGNAINGIQIADSSSATVAGNLVVGNSGAGVSLSKVTDSTVGGPLAAQRNLLSGNLYGLFISGISTNNRIFGNYIGLDATGLSALPNTTAGIFMETGAAGNFLGTDGDGVNDALEGNVIAGNTLDVDVDFTAGANVIAGNLVGTDATGRRSLSTSSPIAIFRSTGLRVGTNADGISDAAERNVFGGTVTIIGSQTTFAGNLVGVGSDETTVLGAAGLNLSSATLATIGGVAAVQRNYFTGIVYFFQNSDQNVFQNNYVGVLPDGMTPISAGLLRLGLSSDSNQIGGSASGAGNLIARVLVTDAGTTANVFEGNLIGVNAAGTNGLGIDQYAFLIENGASGNFVGTPAAGNVISPVNSSAGVGANMHAIVIRGAGTDDNQVRNNLIGLNAGGDQIIGANTGVWITDGAARTILGGAGANEGNVISGNVRGIHVEGAPDTEILGNRIGVDRTGVIDLGNQELGVLITGSAGTIIRRNLVSGNDAGGIQLGDGTAGGLVNGATLQGNTIGANLNGLAPLPNANFGIRLAGTVSILIGGPAIADRNVISGNLGPGVFVDGSSFTSAATIQNNYIGVNRLGNGAVPNNDGVKITLAGPSTSLLNNVISGNAGSGVAIMGNGAGVTVYGNIIGLNATGTIDVGNLGNGVQISNSSGNTVGGANASQRNVISGNELSGIVVFGASSAGNAIQGNFIGTDFTGTLIRGNSQSGVVLASGAANTLIGSNGDGSADQAEGNVIGGNSLHGVSVMDAANTTISGNRIGTDITGSLPLPNLGHGIALEQAAGAMIGGFAAHPANTVANHQGAGIAVISGDGVTIRGNSIYANGELGIDLYPAGVTPNDPTDADIGPNNLQNYPQLTAAFSGSQTTVTGSLASTPDAVMIIDFYASDLPDPSGFGEGQRYLGSATIVLDESGFAVFLAAGLAPTLSGESVTATATDAAGNTSEFSLSQPAASTAPPTILRDSLLVTVIDPEIEEAGFGIPTLIVDEGELFFLTGDFADADSNVTVTIDWGDGHITTDPIIREESFTAWHVYADDNPSQTPADLYGVIVRVTDTDGSGAAIIGITVRNVEPQVTAYGFDADLVDEGQTVALTGAFVDPGAGDFHTVEIDWGDGSGNETFLVPHGDRTFSLEHVYQDDGVYDVRFSVFDDDRDPNLPKPGDAGFLYDFTDRIQVLNVAPTATIHVQANAIEGQEIPISATVVDPGSEDTFTYFWLIELNGEGVASSASENFVFTPEREGLYLVRLTVRDDGHAEFETSAAVSVSNDAPTILPSGITISAAGVPVSSILEGTEISLAGVFSDSGMNDIHHVTVDFGDGSAPVVTAIEFGDRSFHDIRHTYLDDPEGPNDTYLITVTVSDGASSSTAVVPLTVLNADPVVALRVDRVTDATVRLAAEIQDRGILDTHTVAWFVNGAPVAGTNLVSIPRTTGALLNVVFQATDDDGGVGTVTANFIVLDDTDNTVAISDGGGGQVSLAVDGQPPLVFVPGDHLLIATMGGDDVVVVDPAVTINIQVDGGAGNDSIVTAAGDDTLIGGSGNDTLVAGPGNDVLISIEGDDSMVGGAGDDEYRFHRFSHKVLVDDEGIDTLNFEAVEEGEGTFDGVSIDLGLNDGSEQQVHSTGTLALFGDFENVIGSDYSDLIIGSDSPNNLFGGPGDDSIQGVGSEDTIDGGDGDDTLIGGDGDSSIDGGSGNDTIIATAGSGDTIFGGPGDDSILGGAGDTIVGGDGNDTLIGGDGGSSIVGGSGNDTIISSAGSGDTIFGGPGDDSIVGGAGDTIVGGDGNDTIVGGEGNQSITGGTGNDTIISTAGSGDTIFGGPGDDSILGGAGDTISGGDGNDSIIGGEGGSSIDGGSGNDTIISTSGSGDTIFGGPGDDSILGGAGDTIIGGEGNDSITGGEGGSSIDGGSGNDTIISTAGSGDTIFGGPGDDSILGGAGDTIVGGDGNDSIIGGEGGSSIDGGSGNDTIISTAGSGDTIFGGPGDDSILGGSGDTIVGGDGNDSIIGGDGGSSIDGGSGNDTIISTAGSGDTIFGGPGDDSILGGAGDTIVGGDGNDSIIGGDGGSSIDGGSGNDTIISTAGSGDTIFGGPGDDSIVGGAGDTIVGGDGNDSIIGGDGGSSIDGGSGNDTIISTAGSGDTIFGGPGDDSIVGGAGDTIVGGDGNDSIIGGEGGSSIDGGSGNDTIISTAGSGDTIFGGPGDDSILGGAGDTIVGGEGNDSIIGGDGGSSIDGGSGNDTIIATAGSGDTIFGGPGDDSILGGAGDTIVGGDGNDVIIGGDGASSIDGGAGDDTIVSSSAPGDTIFGSAGNDLIVLGGGLAKVFGDDEVSHDPDHLNRILIQADADIKIVSSGESGQAFVTVNGVLVAELTGVREAILAGGASGNLLDASLFDGDAALIGGAGDDTLLGGAGNDTLEGGAGNDSLVGGDGDDTYVFTGANLGADVIDEEDDQSNDTLDFFGLRFPVHIDLSQTEFQNVAPGNLQLRLTRSRAIESAIGTAFSDILLGNDRDNTLVGGGGLDYLYGAAGNDYLTASRTRYVFLDFDSRTSGDDHVYTQSERDGIQARMMQDYGQFDVVISQTRPQAAHYITVRFNDPPIVGGRAISGGVSQRIGFRDVERGGVVQVDVNGFLGTGANRLPPDEQNFIALSSTIASHELGHMYGLRHHDAFGAPGAGIFAALGGAAFLPAYLGPAEAYETPDHLSASPASVRTTLSDALANPFFGEREALKLAFGDTGEALRELPDLQKTDSVTIDGVTYPAQALGELPLLAVPNTIENQTAFNYGAPLDAAAAVVLGTIELDGDVSESDFYSFPGRADEIVTIEVMSHALRSRIGNIIDAVVRVYDADGVLLDYYGSLLGAFNDDGFEPTDSILIDLRLPADGVYYVEVDTFSFFSPEFSAYLPNFNAELFCSFNPSHIGCTDRDTGQYELLIYRFERGVSLAAGDTLIGGAGNDTLVGSSGNDYFLFDFGDTFAGPGSPAIAVMNSPPMLAPIGDRQVDDLSPVQFTVLASDPDPGDRVRYRLRPGGLWPFPSGAAIDPDTGEFFWIPPSEGIFEVVIEAFDLHGLSVDESVVITVGELDFTAVIVDVTGSLEEGSPVTVYGAAIDPSGQATMITLTYEVFRGGELVGFDSALDLASFTFTPDDDGEYLIRLTALSDRGETDVAEQTIVIANVPPYFEAGPDETLPLSAAGRFLRSLTFSDPGNDEWSGTVNFGDSTENFPLTINQAGKSFELDHTYTVQGTYAVTVTLSDGDLGGVHVDTFTVTVFLSSNSPPHISPQTFIVDENETAVAAIAATDPDLPADTLTFSITGAGPDDAGFAITADGFLSFLAAPDYENPWDLGGVPGDNVYLVHIQVTDAAGEWSTAIITVVVAPVNDNAPVVTSAAAVSVAENSTAVQTLTATDADLPPQVVSFSISGGADAEMFHIVDGNQLVFIVAPDFESPQDANGDNVYEVEISADDGEGLTTTQLVLVTVTPVNDNAPVFTSAAEVSVPENSTAVQTLSATDADLPPQVVSFSISGGADAARFQITGGNQLAFLEPPDFESPQDANGDNVYEVEITANDGEGLTTTQLVLVTVTPVNDNAPVFTSAAEVSVPENSTAVQTLSATDADLPPQVVSFSISGGADAARFQITGGNQLAFLDPPDFESPQDANGDNLYEVEITADDGEGLTTTQLVRVTVTPVNDNAPVFTSATEVSVPENSTAVQTLTATDADLPPQVVSFSISGGADATRFQITGGNQLAFLDPPDFESPLDANGDNLYEVEITADDGHGMTTTQLVLVTVTDVNEAPIVVNSIGDISADENDGDYVIDLALVFADVDAGDMLTYSIVVNSNPALVEASLVGSILTLRLLAGQSGVAEITVRATDSGGLSTEDTFAVVVLPTEQQIRELAEDVEELRISGVLNNGNANALISKLSGALVKFDEGNLNAAVNQIYAFINQVNAFVISERLTPAEGESLINAANQILISMEASGGSTIVIASQGAVSPDAAPLVNAGELVIATIGVTLASEVRSVTPEEQARFRAALAVFNDAFGVYGVTLVELGSLAAVDLEFFISLAPTSPCGDASDGVLGCTSGLGIITVLEGWNWYLGEDAALIGASQYDFQTVVTHEIGHAIGLDHSGNPNSVMYFALAAGDVHRSLTDLDLANVRQHDDHSEPEALLARGWSPIPDRIPAVFQYAPLLLDHRRQDNAGHGRRVLERREFPSEGRFGVIPQDDEESSLAAPRDLVDRFFALASESPALYLSDEDLLGADHAREGRAKGVVEQNGLR